MRLQGRRARGARTTGAGRSSQAVVQGPVPCPMSIRRSTRLVVGLNAIIGRSLWPGSILSAFPPFRLAAFVVMRREEAIRVD